MSTSIQEQDLIQTIKQLEQRISDLERQQRTIATTTTLGDKAVRVRKNFSTVQYEQVEMDSNSIEYYFEDSNFPVVNETLIMNFNNTGVDVILTSDFGRGGFRLSSELDLTITGHDVDIPPNSSSTGVKGTIKWDGTNLYVCTATNTWRRVALSTF